MKHLFFLSILAFNFHVQAQSCPSLVGVYSCTDGTDVDETVINESFVNGLQTLTVDGIAMVIDSQPHSVDDGDGTVGTAISSCPNNTLQTDITFTFIGGYAVLDARAVMTLIPTASGFTETIVGRAMYEGQALPLDGTTICTRK